MIALFAALASATAPAGADIWSWPEVASDQAIYLVAPGGDCAVLTVADELANPVAIECDFIGVADETEWPGPTFAVSQDGGFVGELTVIPGTAAQADPAVAVGRTVSDIGVSYRMCHTGTVGGIVRADSEPAEVGADGVLLPPLVVDAHFGVAGGNWPEAGPGATATFWFTTFDDTGTSPIWTSDEVTLLGEGLVRADVRFGYDPAGASCPSGEASWLLGEELDSAGGPVTHDNREPREKEGKGCGCDHGRLALGPWILLSILGIRRYQSPST